jgi:hypothetical protein
MAFRRSRLVAAGLVILLLAGGAVALAPSFGKWYLRARILPAAQRGLSRSLTVEELGIGVGRLDLLGVTVRSESDGPDEPLATIPRVTVDYAVGALLRGKLLAHQVLLEGPAIHLRQRADGTTNFLDLLARKVASGLPGGGKLRVENLLARSGTLTLVDEKRGLQIRAVLESARRPAGGRLAVVLGSVKVEVRGHAMDLGFERVEVLEEAAAEGTARKLPRIKVHNGHAKLLPKLELSAIQGEIAQSVDGKKVVIDLEGSYGGAAAKLWSAKGTFSLAERKGEGQIRAARFSLARISSILKKAPFILYHRTLIDGRMDFVFQKDVLGFNGGFAIEGLNLFHPALARTPVLDLEGKVAVSGRMDFRRQELSLEKLELQSRGVSVQLQGTIDRIFSGRPLLAARLKVPTLPCQSILAALPPSLVPNLKGFELKGRFAVDLQAQIDYDDLDSLKLGGVVGIDRCKVVEAPEQMSAERLEEPFEQQVEVQPGQYHVFEVGPENDDFYTLSEISPSVVHAFLTTEDGGFFRHRGFIPSQFRAALSRNLKKGGFQLGASTMTMQMVKNVLLSPEKTLSRKLQELFLTWYLEQKLTKERILEIYLNVIEFGPGIYGIGAAARHFFGKRPKELTPLEAAFFATLLPSPKRRYVQYCQGTVSDSWDRYTRRILKRMAQKGFVEPQAFAQSEAEKLNFVRPDDTVTEKECKDQIQELLKSWEEEATRRLKTAILAAAPHQLELFIKGPPDSPLPSH